MSVYFNTDSQMILCRDKGILRSYRIKAKVTSSSSIEIVLSGTFPFFECLKNFQSLLQISPFILIQVSSYFSFQLVHVNFLLKTLLQNPTHVHSLKMYSEPGKI